MTHDPYENPDPRCTCIHPEADHDPQTGACLKINPTFGPCPCEATPDDVLAEQWKAHREAREVS